MYRCRAVLPGRETTFRRFILEEYPSCNKRLLCSRSNGNTHRQRKTKKTSRMNLFLLSVVCWKLQRDRGQFGWLKRKKEKKAKVFDHDGFVFTFSDGILELLANQGHEQLTPDKGGVGLGCPEVPCTSVLVLGVLPQGLDTLVNEVEGTSQAQTLRASDVVVHRPESLLYEGDATMPGERKED